MKLSFDVLGAFVEVASKASTSYSAKLKSTPHVLELNKQDFQTSSLVTLHSAIREHGVSAKSVQSMLEQYAEGAIGISYVLSGDSIVIASDSRAGIDIILSKVDASLSKRLGYVPETLLGPSPISEKLKDVVRRVPLASASTLLKKATELMHEYAVSYTSSASKHKAVATVSLDTESLQLAAEFDAAISRYIASDEFLKTLEKSAEVETVVTNSEAAILEALTGTKQKQAQLKNKVTVSGSSKHTTKPQTYKQLRSLTGRFTSLSSIQVALNAALAAQIQRNMGTGNRRDILNYRTGRFAKSAEVTRITQSKEGMLTAFYTYMKYPYQTFEPGFLQGSPASRNPRLLISKSIHELVAKQVSNRLRAVLV